MVLTEATKDRRYFLGSRSSASHGSDRMKVVRVLFFTFISEFSLPKSLLLGNTDVS